MTFSVFRIPVHVQPAFWFTAALLGLNWLMGPKPNFAMFAVWVVVVFVSVMVHELGHAFAIMRHGIAPSISLHWLGGLTSWSGGQRLSRKNRIFISFAGPGAGFILGGIVYGLRAASPEAFAALPSQAQLAVRLVEYVNIFWGLINLIPVLPLDGGHILEDLLGPKRRQATATISLVIGGFVVLFCLMNNQLWIALIFGMMTFQSFQRYREGAPTRAPDR